MVLEKDKRGLIVLVNSKRNGVNELLSARFRRSMDPDITNRIVWINREPLNRYLAMLKLGDVLMLTFPSASGVTVMESLSVGTPFVVYEEMSLGMGMRIEKGFIRELGINASCCVAYTLDEYVDKLVRFGTDQRHRNVVSQDILQNIQGRLFENRNVVNDWIEFLHYVSRNKRPSKHRLLTTPAILGKSLTQNQFDHMHHS